MATAHPFEVSLLGDVNIDILMQIPFYPLPGGDGIAENVTIAAGGSAANTAAVLSRLGVGTQLLSRVGSDPWAEMAVSALRGQGVGLAGIQRDPNINTGMINLTVTPDGERTMFSFRGANARHDPQEIDPDLVAGSRLLHLSGYAFLEKPQSEAAQRAIRIARDHNVPISLDIGVEPARAMGATLTNLLPHLDLLVLGLDEARAITGENSRDASVSLLLDRELRRVALKLGKDGCLLAEGTRWELVPGFSVRTVDSTGAGDAFSAGMLFARLKELDLLQAGLLANALGALATTRWGGGVAFPEISEVFALLRQHPPREEPLRSAASDLLHVLSAYLLSLLCNMAAVRAWGRKPGRFWLLTVLALLLSLVNLMAMEYFFLLELLRPGFIYLALKNQTEKEPESTKNLLRRAAAHWLPYLALFLGAVIWRAFFFPYQHQNYSFGLMDHLKANPLQALLGLAGNVLRDLAQTAALAWTKPFTPDGFRAVGTRTLVVSAALAAGVLALVLIALWKAPRADVEGKARRTWAGQALLLGATGLLLAGPPFWLTGLELHLVYPNDRFTLPFMLGASLLLAGLLALIPGKRIYPLLVVSVLAGASAGLHFREAVSFQRDWNAQKTMFWQMSWRMPGLKPGTTLISSDLPMKYYSDNSLTGPLNWIYAPDNHSQQMDYMFYFASVRSEARALLEPDQPIRQDYLAADFTGSTGQMAALIYRPPACLRVLDAGIDAGNPMLPELMREAAKQSDPRWIFPEGQIDMTPAIYGQEPSHNWCYYFEKADLARQQGDWQRVSELGDQAFTLKDYPNDPMERLPFIEGYALNGRMDDAKAQTEKALAISPLMKEPLCKLWQRIGQSEKAAGAVLAELGCTPQQP